MTGGIASRFVAKSEPTTSLLRYDAACRALAEAKGIDEVKDVRDKAEALRLYGRQAKNKTLEIDAAEIRFRAERRIGQIEIEMHAAGEMHSGGRPTKTGSEKEPVSQKTLADLGIDKKLSSRAQKIAAVPDDKFEDMVATWRDRVGQENERVTTALIKEGEKAERRSQNQQPVEGGGRIDDLKLLISKGLTFGVIYADPPWSYETWSDRGAGRSASQHYDTQKLEEILALPVRQLAALNSILHLWCISSMLPEALRVVEAWGFEYKKIGFIWTKTTKDGGSPKMGNGHWTRDEAEICLLATKGSPKRLDAGVRQTLDAPLTKHSEKPDEFRERIVRLTNGPYLELYGRKEVSGWVVWGDQVRWQPPDEEEWPDDRDVALARTEDGEAFDPETGEILESQQATNGAERRSAEKTDGAAAAGSSGDGTPDQAHEESPDLDMLHNSGEPVSSRIDDGNPDSASAIAPDSEIAAADPQVSAGESPVGARGGGGSAPPFRTMDDAGPPPAFLIREQPA